MKNKIYRNFFFFGFVTMLMMSFIFVFTYNQRIHTQKQEDLREEAELLTEIFEDETLQDAFEAAIADVELRVTLIDRDGTVLYDNVADVTEMENHGQRAEIQEARKYGEGQSSRISDTIKTETYYYAKQLSDGRFLRLSSEGMSTWRGFLQLLPLLALVTVLIFAAAFFIAYRLTKNITGVINAINLENPLEQVRFPELSALQNRLDHQNRKVQTQMRRLKEEEGRLSTITEHMNEGLIMLDSQQTIRYMNQSCRDLFEAGSIDYVGQPLSRFCRSSQIRTVTESALKGEAGTAIQRVNEKKVQYFGNPITENKKVTGMILLILDVTEEERTEKMRKEFSANVSHELKTPLTSITGYAQLMENQMVREEDVPDFAAKIRVEATRLLSLVNDIIKVSQLDDQEVAYAQEKLDLLQIANETAQGYEPMARRQEVTLTVQGESLPYYAPRQMMSDLMHNLVENAIKYNRPGGNVWVTVERRDEWMSVSVKDTGIGIPMKDQTRIFERFFRVDKSHSRQTGGTGLGLSIVKHIVEYCGGYIEVHSTVGEGTEIIIYLQEAGQKEEDRSA